MIAREYRFHFGGPLPKHISKNSFFLIRYQKNSSSVRLGVVVSKKVSKKATERNRIKRVLADTVYDFQKAKNVPYDIVIYVRSGVEALENAKIRMEVTAVLQTINL